MSPNMISALSLAIPMLCYFVAAGNESFRGNHPLALTMFAYGLGNIGFIWGLWK